VFSNISLFTVIKALKNFNYDFKKFKSFKTLKILKTVECPAYVILESIGACVIWCVTKHDQGFHEECID
jgi:hypothetical protein